MEKCVHCGSDTALYVSGVLTCVKCLTTPAIPKTPGDAKVAVPPRGIDTINANLNTARAEYKKALRNQIEAKRLKGDLTTNNPDGSQALHNANRELDVAARKYEDALRDFMIFTDPRTSGR